MPRTAEVVTRHLNETERAARQRFVALFPAKDLELPPTTAGFGEIQSWLDAGEPRTWPPVPAEVAPEAVPAPVWTVVA